MFNGVSSTPGPCQSSNVVQGKATHLNRAKFSKEEPGNGADSKAEGEHVSDDLNWKKCNYVKQDS
jgi:hypothetical protein